MNLLEYYNGKSIGFYDAESKGWRPLSKLIISNGCFQIVEYGNPIHENILFDYYILPGFIDAHCHMFEDPYKPDTVCSNIDKQDDSELFLIASKNTQIACEAGITSIKDLGGRFYSSIITAERLNEKLSASRVFTSGCYFTSRGGHCADRGGIIIDDIDEFIQGLDYLKNHNIQFCKIIHGDDGFKKNLLFDMINEAHKKKMLVSCHSYTEKAAKEAVAAGTDILEHVGDYSDRLLDQIKENNIIVVPTFVAAYDGLACDCVLSDVNTSVMQMWYDAEIEVIPKLFEKGIKVALGTDGGFEGTPFNSLIREIVLINKMFPSISITSLLYCAFIINPQTLNRQNLLGKIRSGYFADFQIYENNPLNDVENDLGHPKSVWVNGEEVYCCIRPDDVVIRNLTISDVNGIIKSINHPFFDCTLQGDFWSNTELESWILSMHDCSIGAFIHNKLIGFCLSHFHKETHKVHIENIYVEEKYRGRGVGSKLLFEIKRYYQNEINQIRYVALVDIENAVACRLLKKAGFSQGAQFYWMQKNE